MTAHATQGPRPLAILCAIEHPDDPQGELGESLDELERLTDTLGLEAIARVTQRRAKPDPGTYFGQGRLAELKAQVEAAQAEHPERPVCVIVDEELSPRQWRTLGEQLPGATIYDRAGVILDIFDQRAQTREAKLQVELARLSYLSPRLRQVKGAGDRQQGGVGGKGAGESQLELRRRQSKERASELRAELERIDQGRQQQRQRRQQLRRVALVGYTNAGKSTLMRALCHSEVYVADQLFATLDTTVRTLHPPVEPPIVIADTVGFVRKLPHDLVASFRTTLEEALEASLLLHVVDASDPALSAHMQTTTQTLASIGADQVPTLLLLNKSDRLEPERRAALAAQHPEAILLSAADPEDIAQLRQTLIARFDGALLEEELAIPHRAGHARALMYETCQILEERYDEHGGRYRVRATAQTLAKLREALTSRGPALISW